MKVSVVVCTHTLDIHEDFTEAVESVFAQTHDDVELVVVVDGHDTLCARIRDEYGNCKNVRVSCNDENQGLLVSRNRGVEAASGDVVAFLDADAVAEPDWIQKLVAAYEDRDVMAVGGRMTPEWVAGRPAFLPEEFYFLIGVTHRGFADGPGEVRNTFGSNISFQREVFEDLGGFDPEIGGRKGDANLQGGETELCARMHDKYGEGVWYVPDAEVAHKVFDYRTNPWWLLNRAFWQGYSKRAMSYLTRGRDENENEEMGFVRRLLFEFVPGRVSQLATDPSVARALQLTTLLLMTGVVGLGYLYGFVEYR